MSRSYTFGPFRVVPAERLLLREERAVPIAPKVFDVLVLLVRRAGSLVSTEELLATVWGGAFVEAGTVTRTVSLLRRALGSEAGVVRTVPKHGYRLAAEVEEASSGERRVVAVLPFEWLGEVPAEGEAVGLGMAESLTARLAEIDGLRLRPTSSVLAGAAPGEDAVTAGYRLGCDLVIEGRLQRLGGSLRATVHAVAVDDGSDAWAFTSDGNAGELFALQDAVAVQAAQRLGRPGEAAPTPRRWPEARSQEAYRLYLKGRYRYNKFQADGIAAAIADLRQATNLDPGFAAAHAALADLYLLSIGFLHHESEVLPQARQAVRTALDLNPRLAEAWTSLAVLRYWHEWARSDAEADYRRAIEEDPDYAHGHHTYAWYLTARGRFREAETEMAIARRLDPLSLPVTTDLGLPAYYRGEAERASEAFRNALDLEPAFWYARFRLGQSLVELADLDGALEVLSPARQEGGAAVEMTMARAEALAGRGARARELVASALETAGPSPPYVFAASVEAALGASERALDLLDRACAERDKWIGWLPVEPGLAALRPLPRFRELARRAGFS